MNKCAYCINKEQCKECDLYWRDKFIPNDDVKKYFTYSYVGVRGLDGYQWVFDTTNEHLIPTHAIRIHNSYYCPYCCEKMLYLQDKKSLDLIGYTCICEGARAELEYEKKLKGLKEKFENDCVYLRRQYSEKLKFDTYKLLSIKQHIESKSLSESYTHFNKINGENISNIDQML